MTQAKAVVVGAGLAGLACALHLVEAGWDVQVLEASDDVGGRVRTDSVEGYLVDRGFQVLLTEWPEVRRLLDLDALDLRPFLPGALLRLEAGFVRVGDPLRDPRTLVPTTFSPIGSFADKLRVLRYRWRVGQRSVEALMQRPDRAVLTSWAEEEGFSPAIVERFLRPFLAGVFLDPTLDVSRRAVEPIWKMFAEGDAAVPARGMGAIAQQLADRVGREQIRCRMPVVAVHPGRVEIAGGEVVQADYVVVATDQQVAAELTRGAVVPRPSLGVTCLYFEATRDPVGAPLIVVNATGVGPIHTLHCATSLERPVGLRHTHLICASVLGAPAPDDELLQRVEEQRRAWFGGDDGPWRLVRSYRIPDALPAQRVGDLEPPERSVRVSPGLYVCGDHLDQSSIQGALASGRRAAEAVLVDAGAPVDRAG